MNCYLLLDLWAGNNRSVLNSEKRKVMRKIGFIVLIIGLLLNISERVSGQNTVRRVPGKYLMPMDNASAEMPGNKNKEGELWIAFSDRKDNQLFSDKTCRSAAAKKLSFMQAMYVIEETPDAIRVVEINDADPRGNLKEGATARSSWIKKDNMLLWRTCLKTRDVKLPEFRDGVFNKKAMVLNIVSGAQKQFRVPSYYSHPRCNAPDSINSALVYQITYVYKETEDAYLLGDLPQITNIEKEVGYIRGWVRKSQTSAWNHRIAYEINWDPKAVAERKAKGVKAKITTGQQTSSTPIFQEPATYYSSRAIGEIDRFPVLDVLNGVSRVGVIGDLVSESGKTLTSKEFAEIKNVIDSISTAQRNVNIIFVVDGTSSMIPYSKAIQDALRNTWREFTKSKNSFKFGLMIYRDASEGTANVTSFTRDISPNYSNVTSALSKFMIAPLNKCNNDHEEAVFYGIKKAIERFDPPAGESNFVILIGDAGNHNRKMFTDCSGTTQADFSLVDQNELTNLLVKKNINLISYQTQHHVTSDLKPVYDGFRNQVKSLMSEVAVKRVDDPAITGKMQVLTQPSKSTFEINPSLGVFGTFTQAPDGGMMHPNVLAKEVQDGLLFIDQKVNQHLDAIAKYVNGKLEGNHINQLSGFIKQLHQQKIPADKLDIVFQKSGQIYTTGYTYRTEKGMANPTYQSVLLMSQEDLFSIRKSLDRIVPTDNMSLSASESRAFIYYGWGEILVDILGYFPKADETVDTLSLYSLSAILTGWGGKEKFKSILLNDVIKPDKFPDEMLYEYLIDWCITKGHIQSIYDGQNLLTGDFYEDHKFTIFSEYLFHLTKGKSQDDPETKTNFVNYFKKYDYEYNHYKASFRIPVGTGSGLKHYWVDSRIFPHNAKEFGEKDIIEVLYPKYVK